MEDLASLETLNDNDRIVLERQQTELKEIYHALSKIKNETYGICEETSRPIPIERLRANPIARTIVSRTK
jgi:DnaK suppressor protein